MMDDLKKELKFDEFYKKSSDLQVLENQVFRLETIVKHTESLKPT